MVTVSLASSFPEKASSCFTKNRQAGVSVTWMPSPVPRGTYSKAICSTWQGLSSSNELYLLSSASKAPSKSRQGDSPWLSPTS